nr:ERF family protein [uncultured Flavobacterium sp.]
MENNANKLSMETNGINEKMFEFQKRVQAIKKDAKNPHFKNTYASLNQILSEVKPLLTEVGLVLTQPVQGNKVITMVVCTKSGQSFCSEIDLPTGLTPQQIGSAITYYRRYTISGLLSLETEDDDGSDASLNIGDKRAWLNENTEVFKQAVAYLKNGGLIGEVEKKYKMTEKTKESLITEAAK